MIDLKTGTRIWIAAGFTDLRRGFQGLSTLVETALEHSRIPVTSSSSAASAVT